MKQIVCFTDEDDTSELRTVENQFELHFIDDFSDMPEADIYIISLKKATDIFVKFLQFMRDRPKSRFFFLEEYKRTLSDEDFNIRFEPNTDIYMYSPKAALKAVSIYLKSIE